METDDFRALLTWFRELADEIRNTGTPAEITSGLACVHHRLAEVTKDCDIWIPPTSLAAFKHRVLTRQWQGNRAVYRSALSVPLDARWLNGGWSAHIVWEGRPKAQVDVFGRMPRILQHSGGDLYSDEETLARVKMTRREKDWPTVHALGERLITKGDPKGLLFLQKAESLFAAKEKFSREQWAKQAKDRPLLDCFDGAIQVTMLAAHLRTEQTFWRQVDHHRMETYREAGKNYAKAAHKILNTLRTFAEQDLSLTKLAEELLPTHPLQDKADSLIGAASEDALANVDQSRFNSSWLPIEWAKATLCPT
ncbi:hypothetical protein [Pseudomonas sp.]|uniref:hypothetical protein n=1 Tax=Pseudomonas sp. TaxID=306 RepID=UPI003C645B89